MLEEEWKIFLLIQYCFFLILILRWEEWDCFLWQVRWQLLGENAFGSSGVAQSASCRTFRLRWLAASPWLTRCCSPWSCGVSSERTIGRPYMPAPASTSSAGLATVISLPLTTSRKNVCVHTVCVLLQLRSKVQQLLLHVQGAWAKASSFALEWIQVVHKIHSGSVMGLVLPRGAERTSGRRITPVVRVPGRCHKVWEAGTSRK